MIWRKSPFFHLHEDHDRREQLPTDAVIAACRRSETFQRLNAEEEQKAPKIQRPRHCSRTPHEHGHFCTFYI
jgi:hypothetical protein